MTSGIRELDSPVFGENKPAWHQAGTVLEGVLTRQDAFEKGGLNIPIIKVPLYAGIGVSPGIPSETAIPDWFATIRSDLQEIDTRRVLGVVGAHYQVVQNEEAFDFLDDLSRDAQMEYATAGTLFNGKRMWVLAKLPRRFQIGDDQIDTYLLFTQGHDGIWEITIAVVKVRVVCWNTLQMALASAPRTFSIRHTKNYVFKLAQAKRALEGEAKYSEAFERKMTDFASTRLSGRFINAFLAAFFPEPNILQRPRASLTACRKKDLVKSLFVDSRQMGGTQPELFGTAYGLYNALMQMNDHHTIIRPKRERGTGARRSFGEARFDSIMWGTRATFRSAAFQAIDAVLPLARRAFTTNTPDRIAGIISSLN